MLFDFRETMYWGFCSSKACFYLRGVVHWMWYMCQGQHYIPCSVTLFLLIHTHVCIYGLHSFISNTAMLCIVLCCWFCLLLCLPWMQKLNVLLKQFRSSIFQKIWTRIQHIVMGLILSSYIGQWLSVMKSFGFPLFFPMLRIIDGENIHVQVACSEARPSSWPSRD